MPEKDGNLIAGFIATIGTALTLFGINLKWVQSMNRKIDKIPEKYQPQDLAELGFITFIGLLLVTMTAGAILMILYGVIALVKSMIGCG